jgi:hypothetical protein
MQYKHLGRKEMSYITINPLDFTGKVALVTGRRRPRPHGGRRDDGRVLRR